MLNTNIPFIAYCENKFQRKLHKAFKMKNFCLTLENLKVNKKRIFVNNFFYNLNIEINFKKRR